MRPSHLITTLLLSSASFAWPTGSDSPAAALDHQVAPLAKRESTSFDLSFSGPQGNTATTSSTAKETGKEKSGKDDTTSPGVTGTGKHKSGDASPSPTTTKTFNQLLPPGGISMVTPGISVTSYYKIKDYVTFAWNFTSLSVTPSQIDILASCSANQETYTIALNQSVTKAATQAVTWDTGGYQSTATIPLLTETYTLIIHEAGQPMSAVPMAGYLGVYDQFTFGMYVPQSYTPIADWVCATCNAAMSTAERQTMWFLFGTAGMTVLSFGWFTGVAGLW